MPDMAITPLWAAFHARGFVVCVVHPPMPPGDCVGACPFLSSGHKLLAHEYQRSYDVRKIFVCIRFVSADQWGKLMPWECVDCPCMLVSRTVRSGSCCVVVHPWLTRGPTTQSHCTSRKSSE
eukprot:gene16362-biopygen12800